MKEVLKGILGILLGIVIFALYISFSIKLIIFAGSYAGINTFFETFMMAVTCVLVTLFMCTPMLLVLATEENSK